MADKPVFRVDELSKEERVVVAHSLDLQLNSFLRAAKSAKSDALRRTFEAEASSVRALIERFSV